MNVFQLRHPSLKKPQNKTRDRHDRGIVSVTVPYLPIFISDGPPVGLRTVYYDVFFIFVQWDVCVFLRDKVLQSHNNSRFWVREWWLWDGGGKKGREIIQTSNHNDFICLKRAKAPSTK